TTNEITIAPASAGTMTVQFAHTVQPGSNQFLVVTGTSAGDGITTSVSYGGIPMIRGNARTTGTPRIDNGSGFYSYFDYWYLVNPPQGTHNVVAQVPLNTARSGEQARQYAAITIQNVNQTNPVDQDATATGTGGNPSVLVNTSEANELVLYFLN